MLVMTNIEFTSSPSLSTHFFQHNSISTMAAVAGPSTSTKPVTPFYCEVCILHTEYCEFGPSFSKCKTWLESEDKGEFDRLWGEGRSLQSKSRLILTRTGSLAGRMGTLSMDKQEKLEKDAEKAEKKAEKKAEAEQKRKEVSPSPSSRIRVPS